MKQQANKVASGRGLAAEDSNKMQINIETVAGAKLEKDRKEYQTNDQKPSAMPSPCSVTCHNQYLSVDSSCLSSGGKSVSCESGKISSPPSQMGSSTFDVASLARSQNSHHKLIQSQNRERKIFVTLTYVLSSYLICWFPFYIAFDTYAWKPELVPGELYTFFFWMTYVNSTLNPFIYAYTSKEFRSAFVKVLRCLYKCKT